MKKQVLTLVGVLSLLLAAGSALGQTIHVRADIPFSFVVKNQTLPAGQYEIQSLGTSGEKTLLIRGANVRPRMLVMANGVESRTPSCLTKLVFNRRGDRYFLSQVWVEGNDFGHHLPISSREAEAAANYAAQQVVILAQVR